MSILTEEGARGLDPHLAERFRSRDPEALGLVFDRFAPNGYAFVSRVEADAGEVDRMVEEVFWTLWLSAARPESETDVERLLRLALGTCLRRRHVQRTR